MSEVTSCSKTSWIFSDLASTPLNLYSVRCLPLLCNSFSFPFPCVIFVSPQLDSDLFQSRALTHPVQDRPGEVCGCEMQPGLLGACVGADGHTQSS